MNNMGVVKYWANGDRKPQGTSDRKMNAHHRISQHAATLPSNQMRIEKKDFPKNDALNSPAAEFNAKTIQIKN